MTGRTIKVADDLYNSIKEVIKFFKDNYGIDVSAVNASKVIAKGLKEKGVLKVIITESEDTSKKNYWNIKVGLK